VQVLVNTNFDPALVAHATAVTLVKLPITQGKPWSWMKALADKDAGGLPTCDELKASGENVG